MIPTSVKPIAYFFAPFTCNSNQFPERDTKGPFIFTLTDSKNKKYYFSMTDTQYMINLSLYANEWQYSNKGTVKLFAEKSPPSLPPAKQIVITPTLPTYPYQMNFSKVSIGNCRGYTVKPPSQAKLYYEFTKKKSFPPGDFDNVCAITLTTKSNSDYNSLVTNFKQSLEKKPITFMLPKKPSLSNTSGKKYTIINIIESKNPIIKTIIPNEPNTLFCVLSEEITINESASNIDITFSLTTKPIVSSPTPAPAPAPSGSSVKPSTSKTIHQPSSITPAPSPAVSEKKNLTLKARCSSYVSSNSNTPHLPPISPLTFSSTNLSNDKYSLTVRFQPGIIDKNRGGPSGKFSGETTVTLVPSSQPQELEKMEITSTYTPYIFSNKSIPTTDLNKAIFLSPLACWNDTMQANPFAKGPYIFTLTNTKTNEVYKFQMTDKEYLSLSNSINSSKNLQSLTLTEMEQTKTSSSTAITGSSLVMKASCIGGPTFAKLTFSPGTNKTLSSTNKYTLDMIFINPMKFQGNFIYDVNGMTVPIVKTPTLLNDITISTSSNNTNPGSINDPDTKQLAGFLNIFSCGQAPYFINNTFDWAKGPFKFRFTEQETNNTYEYTLTNEDYINLGFDVHGLQKYRANNLSEYPGGGYFGIIPTSKASITLTN